MTSKNGVEEADRVKRIRFALRETFDSGNSLVDAWNEVLFREDGHEIELAMMGMPTISDNTLKSMDYYWRQLRKYYIDNATAELDAQEFRYKGDRSMS